MYRLKSRLRERAFDYVVSVIVMKFSDVLLKQLPLPPHNVFSIRDTISLGMATLSFQKEKEK
jgi:hypothetical protein